MKTKIKLKVQYFMCYENGKLRVDSLLKYLIQASSQNTQEVEGDAFAMPWVLYRWYIKMFGEINSGDEIEIETFIRQNRGFYAYRVFSVFKDGKKLVDAEARWLLLDEKFEKIRKIPQEVIDKYGEYEGYEAPRKEIKQHQEYNSVMDIQIRKSDLDQNHHVNNSSYLQYADEGRTSIEREIDTIEVVYKKQVFYGEEIRLEYTENDKTYEFAITNNDGLKTIGRLNFK